LHFIITSDYQLLIICTMIDLTSKRNRYSCK